MSETLEPQVFSIEKLDATQLPELQGLKEKQLQIVKENPFVAITDNATFEAAKKARTTLVSARTEIQNQDKLIASKIKKIRDAVAGISKDLISITLPHEEKQQEEVKRWEAIKEAEKAEKQRLEDERIESIKEAIEKVINEASAKIEALNFERIESLKVDFEQNLYKTDASQFEEFELDFNEKLNFVKSQFAAKEKQLNELEAQRLENIRLEAEKKKLEAERAELDRQKAENEAKAEADRKAIADQQKAAQDKLNADRKALEDEKNRIAKEEADKKAKEEADRLAAEKAEADRIHAENEAARLEALKPEKEKIIAFAQSISFTAATPEIESIELKNEMLAHLAKIEQLTADFIAKIKEFK